MSGSDPVPHPMDDRPLGSNDGYEVWKGEGVALERITKSALHFSRRKSTPNACMRILGVEDVRLIYLGTRQRYGNGDLQHGDQKALRPLTSAGPRAKRQSVGPSSEQCVVHRELAAT